tara:strand:+ start:127 stop:408 length:282 start_codon:yes stop_codon:yes gene_type:complete
VSSGAIAAREMVAAHVATAQEKAPGDCSDAVMDDLTQVYQSGVRAQVIIPGVPVRDGAFINIINIGTLYSQSFHAFGGSDGYDELVHGCDINS